MDPVLKTGKQQCFVGSNPTPSARAVHGVSADQTPLQMMFSAFPVGPCRHLAHTRARQIRIEADGHGVEIVVEHVRAGVEGGRRSA
jgi:hypothetical protein